MAKHDADSLVTRASLLGRLKNWEDAESWQEFTRTYSRLIRGVAIQAGLTEAGMTQQAASTRDPKQTHYLLWPYFRN